MKKNKERDPIKKPGQFRILAKKDKAMERKSGSLELPVVTLPDLGFCY